MSNINFKDYLNEQLKDPEFKKEFENETTKLESAIALTKVRKESGLSQRDLATVSDVPQSTIGRIENHSMNPSLDMVMSILNILNVNIVTTHKQEGI